MANHQGFRTQARQFRQLSTALRSGMRPVDEKLIRKGQRIADEVIRADLGDTSMSGWPRGNPIELGLRAKKLSGRTHGVIFFPARHVAGPLTVRQRGRNRVGAGGLERSFSGPAMNHRTGVTARNRRTGNLIRRRSRRRRWNGTTDGKGTGDRITSRLQRELPDVVIEGVAELTRRTIGG